MLLKNKNPTAGLSLRELAATVSAADVLLRRWTRRLMWTSCGWGAGGLCLQGWKWWAHPELPRPGGVRKRGLGLAVSAPGQEACVVEFSFLVLIPYSVTGGDDTCVLSLSEHQRDCTSPGIRKCGRRAGGVSWEAPLGALGSGGPLPSLHILDGGQHWPVAWQKCLRGAVNQMTWNRIQTVL